MSVGAVGLARLCVTEDRMTVAINKISVPARQQKVGERLGA